MARHGCERSVTPDVKAGHYSSWKKTNTDSIQDHRNQQGEQISSGFAMLFYVRTRQESIAHLLLVILPPIEPRWWSSEPGCTCWTPWSQISFCEIFLTYFTLRTTNASDVVFLPKREWVKENFVSFKMQHSPWQMCVITKGLQKKLEDSKHQGKIPDRQLIKQKNTSFTIFGWKWANIFSVPNQKQEVKWTVTKNAEENNFSYYSMHTLCPAIG